MGKNKARKIALEGGKTVLELRELVKSYKGGDSPANINKGIRREDAKKIFLRALYALPDEYVFEAAYYDDRGKNLSARDTLLVTNVLRECG